MTISSPAPAEQSRVTLFWRLVRLFSLSVFVVWALLLLWVAFVSLADGAQEARQEVETYSKQILPVAVALADSPLELTTIFDNLERLEIALEESEQDDFFIDIEVSGSRVYSGAVGFQPPALEVGYKEYEFDDNVWWSYTSSSPSAETGAGVLARVTFKGRTAASIELPGQLAAFFIPLLVSLPLLLIPAWFMARVGLRPLEVVAAQISERIDEHSLEPLHGSRYRELNSVVVALNRLLGRLKKQLERERNLVAEVAHELKTPLAIVQTNQGILQTTSDDQRRAAALDDIGAGVTRCNHLVQQLLGLARLEKQLDAGSRSRDLDVAEFVRLRIAHAEVLASERSITLDLLAPDSLAAALDVDAFAAALDNLLDNAIKYSPLGGSVQVELELLDSDNNLQLTVIDHGPGIAPQWREKAFERFERLDARSFADAVDGAGLGLTIVRRAVDRLSGVLRLQAHQADGSGLKVSIEFPSTRR